MWALRRRQPGTSAADGVASVQSTMEHVDTLLQLDARPRGARGQGRDKGAMTGETVAKLHLVEKHIRHNKLQVKLPGWEIFSTACGPAAVRRLQAQLVVPRRRFSACMSSLHLVGLLWQYGAVCSMAHHAEGCSCTGAVPPHLCDVQPSMGRQQTVAADCGIHSSALASSAAAQLLLLLRSEPSRPVCAAAICRISCDSSALSGSAGMTRLPLRMAGDLRGSAQVRTGCARGQRDQQQERGQEGAPAQHQAPWQHRGQVCGRTGMPQVMPDTPLYTATGPAAAAAGPWADRAQALGYGSRMPKVMPGAGGGVLTPEHAQLQGPGRDFAL